MGCDLLGLDLGESTSSPHSSCYIRTLADYDVVRNWEFFRHTPSTGPDFGGEIDPRKLLHRRSSLVVQDMPVAPLAPADMKTGGHGVKPPPSVFEEPDANSLLDSFGF